MTTVNEMVKPMLGDRFEVALVMMYRLHRSQVRKGSPVPYVAHLLGVAALVLEDGGDEDEAIAALLHDAMEDQGLRRDVLRLRFGDRVCEIVEGCTEPVVVPRLPWRERKLLHLAKVEGATVSVRRVTMADKLHNVRSRKASSSLGFCKATSWMAANHCAIGTWLTAAQSLIFVRIAR